MKPYLIRKCPNCGMWHLWQVSFIGPEMFFDLMVSFEQWYDQGLLLINFPDVVLGSIE